MKIVVNFIDSHGFYHRRIAESKKLLLEYIKHLAKNTSVTWHKRAEVTISQQYCQK